MGRTRKPNFCDFMEEHLRLRAVILTEWRNARRSIALPCANRNNATPRRRRSYSHVEKPAPCRPRSQERIVTAHLVKRVGSKSLFDAGTCRRSRDRGRLDDFRAFFRTLPQR